MSRICETFNEIACAELIRRSLFLALFRVLVRRLRVPRVRTLKRCHPLRESFDRAGFGTQMFNAAVVGGFNHHRRKNEIRVMQWAGRYYPPMVCFLFGRSALIARVGRGEFHFVTRDESKTCAPECPTSRVQIRPSHLNPQLSGAGAACDWKQSRRCSPRPYTHFSQHSEIWRGG